MQLTEMFAHPMKSARGVAFSRAYAASQGLLHDREWLLATPDGQQITARSHPQLLRVQPALIPGGVLFQHPERAPIFAMSTVYTRAHPAVVWKDGFDARHGDPRVDDWFSQLLGLSCRLLWLGPSSNRRQKSCDAPLSFADGAPYLLISQASLEALNLELAAPVTARHFRPNLVIDGEYAWEEDEWQVIRIGEVVFDVVRLCTRCSLTTVDPDTGLRSADQEPLQTLVRTRTLEAGVCFGINLAARNEGVLNRRDPVEVLESRYQF
ncbi:molybdenum cofactor biosysynthesis protein [Xenophilus sp. AP218F]|nr:MOSC N-terminal beta barrel domain-containing protein [Chromobacterium sp. ASV5]OWY41125.1 molybdenum cofactor biosysynthesis protein [Xenophilus sp. AP218F]